MSWRDLPVTSLRLASPNCNTRFHWAAESRGWRTLGDVPERLSWLPNIGHRTHNEVKAAIEELKQRMAKQGTLTPGEVIDIAYNDINAALQPMMIGDGGNHKGEGGDRQVIAARNAFAALQILRQYARGALK